VPTDDYNEKIIDVGMGSGVMNDHHSEGGFREYFSTKNNLTVFKKLIN